MISLSAKALLCAFICLSLYSNAKLTVRNPTDLNSKFDAVNGLDYTILTPQNKITYKRSFIGNAILADPKEACSNLKAIETIGNDAIYNPILIVSWGECHYAQKVKNAEVAGAKMVILVLRHDMPSNHPVTRQITALNTNIEVLAVSGTDGEKLVSWMEANKPEANPDNLVELSYSYDIEKHPHYQSKNEVNIEFWYSASDLSKISYDLIKDLREILAGFTNHFTFRPEYVVWQAHEDGNAGFKKANPRCISGGRYCDPEPLVENRLSGAHAVVEDLRQLCIRELGGSLTSLDGDWWKYTTEFGNRCIEKTLDQIEDCRDDVYEAVGISSKTIADIENTMAKTFEGGISSGEKYENVLVDNINLRKELEDKQTMQVDHYPALYVNKERYTGSFRNKFAIQEFICTHFVQEELPPACRPAENTSTTIQVVASHDAGVYVLIVIVSILAMAIMLYCVRRTVKRQVMGRMNDEISHIVTQYKQFKDKSNTFGDDDA